MQILGKEVVQRRRGEKCLPHYLRTDLSSVLLFLQPLSNVNGPNPPLRIYFTWLTIRLLSCKFLKAFVTTELWKVDYHGCPVFVYLPSVKIGISSADMSWSPAFNVASGTDQDRMEAFTLVLLRNYLYS